MTKTTVAGVLSLLLIAGPQAALAEQRPKWEVGIGVLPSTFPDYRGSKNQQTYFLPIPYAVYRGENVKVDRQGLRGKLFESYRLKLNLSGFVSVPVNSEDNEKRRGMPDLDPAFEFGGALEFLIREYEDSSRLRLRMPLRAVIATDFRHAQYAGWRFNPHLNYHIPKAVAGWDLGLNGGLLFATRDYHDYYYSVPEAYATAVRPAYEAPGGYSGANVYLSLTKHTERFWYGGFLRYDNLSGAAFEDSPLVETEHAWSAGLGFAWKFYKSKTMVETNGDED